MGGNTIAYVLSSLTGASLVGLVYLKAENKKNKPFITYLGLAFSLWCVCNAFHLELPARIIEYFSLPVLLHFTLISLKHRFFLINILKYFYIASGVLAFIQFFSFMPVKVLYSIYVLSSAVVSVFFMQRRFNRTLSSAEKNNIKYLFLVIASFSLGALFKSYNSYIYIAGNLSMLGIAAYVILVPKKMTIEFLIKRSGVYAALIGIIIGAYIFSIVFLEMKLGKKGELSLIITAFAVALAAIGFAPLEKKLQGWTDTIFFRKRFDYHKTILSICRAMTSIVHLDSLYELLVITIYKEMRVRQIELFIKNNEGDYVPRIQRGELDLPYSSFAVNDPLIEEMIQTEKTVIRSELDKGKIKGIPMLRRRSALLYVPLLLESDLLGFLSIGEKKSTEPFYQEDMYLLDTLAHQAVMAIQNTRSFKKSENKIIEMKTVTDVGKIISSSLELQNILDTIIKSVSEVVGVDRGMLLLYDEKTEMLEAKAGHGVSREEIATIRLPVHDSIFGRVMLEGSPVRQKISQNNENTKRLHAKDYIAVPMKTKDKAIGLLAVDNQTSGESLENVNMELLVTLANQTAMAIDNAKLYEETHSVKTYNENILKYMTSGVITIDSDGKIRTFNKQAEAITGLSAEEVLRKSYLEVWKNKEEFLNIFHSPQQNVSLRLEDKNKDEYKYVTVNTVALKSSNKKQEGMLAVLTDMTEVKNLEDQVRRSDRLSALGTMAAGLAHEIKNPLASMKLFVQLMSDSWQDPDFWQNYGSIIETEVERLTCVVEDFLGFARSYELKVEAMPVMNVVEKVKKLLDNQILKSKITFTVNAAPDLPYVKLDKQRLTQVFMNIILNGIQAIPQEQEFKSICINVFEEGTEVVVEIKNNGPAISKEHQEKLFTPFFTTKKKGTGLGLSIVHRIVEEHEGKIWVESSEGKETSFFISLPKATQTAEFISKIEDGTAKTFHFLTPSRILSN